MTRPRLRYLVQRVKALETLRKPPRRDMPLLTVIIDGADGVPGTQIVADGPVRILAPIMNKTHNNDRN